MEKSADRRTPQPHVRDDRAAVTSEPYTRHNDVETTYASVFESASTCGSENTTEDS